MTSLRSLYNYLFQRRFYDYYIIAGFTFLAILQGYHFGKGDLSTYIPFVWHEFDPAYFANDLLTETISAHPVYIWKALAVLLHVLDIEIIFKTLFLLQIVVIAASIRFFYRHFFGETAGWIILLATLTIPVFSAAMGRYGLNPYSYFHPGALAAGLLFLGYTYIDRRQWIHGGLIYGFLFWIHPFTAVYGGLFLGVKLLVDFIRDKDNFPWIDAGMALGIILLVAAPSWMPYLLHLFEGAPDGFDKALWLELVRMRMKFSFFMSMWVPDRFIHLLLAAAGIAAFRKHPAFWRLAPILIATLVALMLMGLGEWLEIKLFLQLQLARNSFVLFILISALVIDALMHADLSTFKPLNLLWLLVPCIMILQTPVGNRHEPLRWLLVGVALLGISLLMWRRPTNWRSWYIGLALSLVLLASMSSVYQRYEIHGRFIETTDSSDWENIQRWCAENLPLSETIMTPVYLEGFRGKSLHGIYASYKDGAPHNYAKGTIFRWWRRMEAIGCKLPLNRDDLPQLYHQKAVEVARREGIRYLVYDKEVAQYADAALYENRRFGVLDLELLPDLEFN